MFQELMPLLAQRTLLLMVSRVHADEISVNVIPQPVKSSNRPAQYHGLTERTGRRTAQAAGGICRRASWTVQHSEDREGANGGSGQGSERVCAKTVCCEVRRFSKGTCRNGSGRRGRPEGTIRREARRDHQFSSLFHLYCPACLWRSVRYTLMTTKSRSSRRAAQPSLSFPQGPTTLIYE